MTTIEVRVGPLSCAWPSIPPGVIAACRHLQAVTHQAYREGFAAAVDHAVLYFDAFAKNAATSCKKSRSFLTRASSRFMATIPSSPRLPMTLECLRTAALGFTTPAPRHIGIDPQLTRGLAGQHSGRSGQLDSLTPELGGVFSSFRHDTPPRVLSPCSGVYVKPG